jgi:CDP-diacylglycerol--serine O-phosphatidyltransferase
MFIFKFHQSQLLTNFSLLVACYGIITAGQERTALVCLLICGLADLFDGPLARLSQRSKLIQNQGVELDSLTDVVAFAILPLAIFQSLGLTSWYLTLAQFFLVLAAVTRLSVFNLTVFTGENKTLAPQSFYHGLPVTTMAIFVPLLYLSRRFFTAEVFPIFALMIIVVLALAMVWHFKVPKPRRFGAYLGLVFLVLGLILAMNFF